MTLNQTVESSNLSGRAWSFRLLDSGAYSRTLFGVFELHRQLANL